jgi:quinoprotein glucose dehydrogenase
MARQLSYVIVIAALALASLPVASAQTDWPTYGHDAGSTRFSPLKQVSLTNVSKLTRAWTFHVTPPAAETSPVQPTAGGRGSRRARGSEATPVVAGGLMYMPTPYNRVVALEPETGKQIWEFRMDGANASGARVSSI